MAHRLDAGTQRYSVGIETPRFSATSRGDIPLLRSLRADSTFPGVIRRLRPPYEHINPYGKYRFEVEEALSRSRLRPLRQPNEQPSR